MDNILSQSSRRLGVTTKGDSLEELHVTRYGCFITADSRLNRTMERVGKFAATDLSVLLIGETGTGKELVANYIHQESARRCGPFVAVNCGAVSRDLFESTFFGYERGAFTGADPRGRKGLFECAAGGTLFLDEVGELPPDIQTGLLRVLEVGTYRRIGSDHEFSTDCRIIAATNRPLIDMISERTFRSDLYYRLNVLNFLIPPLRERPNDIPVLAEHMANRFFEKHDLPKKTFTRDALDLLTKFNWPGNGRELRNVVESSVLCAGDLVTPSDLPSEVSGIWPDREPSSADEIDWSCELKRANPGIPESYRIRDCNRESELIVAALGAYSKATLAANALGISRSTLYRRMTALGIDPKRWRRQKKVDGPSIARGVAASRDTAW